MNKKAYYANAIYTINNKLLDKAVSEETGNAISEEPPQKKAKKQSIFNEDGYSLEKAKIIYAPSGRAREYAELAANLYRGCSHRCLYCYAPNVVRMGKAEFFNSARPRDGILKKFYRDSYNYKVAYKEYYEKTGIKLVKQVLFSFTTDPYQPIEASHVLTRAAMVNLIEMDTLNFAVLTKAGALAQRDIDLFRPGRDSFAVTLSTLDQDRSTRWETRAATPYSRIANLIAFKKAKINTWVSIEPAFSVRETLDVIRRTHEYTDLYKIGKMNYTKLKIDWNEYANTVVDYLEKVGVSYMVKDDLKKYLKGK